NLYPPLLPSLDLYNTGNNRDLLSFPTRRSSDLYLATCLRFRGRVRCEIALAAGQWRLLRFIDGKLESAQYLETDGTRITRIHAQRNPDKLAQLAQTLGCELSALA